MWHCDGTGEAYALIPLLNSYLIAFFKGREGRTSVDLSSLPLAPYLADLLVAVDLLQTDQVELVLQVLALLVQAEQLVNLRQALDVVQERVHYTQTIDIFDTLHRNSTSSDSRLSH